METQGRFILMNIDEFGQWLSTNQFARVIKLVQNHHTYIPNYSHFRGSNHFQLLQGMENSHIQRGFAEIAQNLTTFPDGTIAFCRALDKIPAGIKGANQYGICIENLGYFDTGGDTMTDEQKTTIIKANAFLCKKFNLTPGADTIVYHHWYDLNTGLFTGGTGSTKSCPGTNFFGGNTVQDCKDNFIPLVQAEMDEEVPVITAPAVMGNYEVNTYVLNVRSGPGTGYAVIRTLQKGTTVSAYEEQNGWCRILPAEQQWVSKSYLAEK